MASLDRPASVLIVGAGIGGLAAALAVRRAGWPVRVFERAPEIRELGAGLTVQPNAILALRALDLGLDRAVIEAGHVPSRLRILDANGKALSDIPAARLYEEVGASGVALHRADLQRILLDALGREAVTTGAEALGFETRSDGVTLRLRNATSHSGSILVGADGVRSAVRAQLLSDGPPRYSGYTSWRGVAEGFGGRDLEVTESWGSGRRFGVVPIGRGRVYWFATRNAPADGDDGSDGARARLVRLFSGWHPPIPELLATTPEAAILRTDIVDRAAAPRWGEGPVTLLGDAAHPMTPNLGQGACQAIEDAVVLGRCLVAAADPLAALRRYEAARRSRADAVVRIARRFGALAQVESAWLCSLRDLLMRATPSSFNERQVLDLWRFSL